MFRTAVITVIVAITVVVGLPVGQEEAAEPDLAFVLRNITTLWEELHSIRQEIGNHLHHGHQEPNHDQVLQEVETLHHEHHVHHLHHPHEGHNAHHNADLLNHLSEVHGHLDDHSDGQPIVGHLHGHGHSHDHQHEDQEGEHTHEHTHEHEHEHEDGTVHTHDHAHEHDHDHEEHDHGHDDIHDGQDHVHDGHHHHPRHHENEDSHDAHGLHSHENEQEYAHEHEPDSHDHHHDHISETDHRHHDHSGENDDDDDDDDDKDGESAMHKTDPWMYANCNLRPNVDMPESNVRGSIIISQKKDKTGPVYFDLNLTGFDVANTGRIHGFHVHESAVTEGKCGSTGGHFNPAGVVHGAPEDDIRHVGDLGNIEVDENGSIQGHIIADRKVAFMGSNTIIRKAIVVHAGVDDLGKGGDAGSLATGNAGGRLACCNIFMGSENPDEKVHFRFKG